MNRCPCHSMKQKFNLCFENYEGIVISTFLAAADVMSSFVLSFLDSVVKNPAQEGRHHALAFGYVDADNVGEYWTVLPPKAEFERKIQEILIEVRERLKRRKMLPSGDVQRKIE